MNEYNVDYNSIQTELDQLRLQDAAKAEYSRQMLERTTSISSALYLVIVVLMAASVWKIFVKAGEAGWKCFIPIYNMVVFLKILKLSAWYILLLFIPLVNFVIGVSIVVKTAKVFGKSTGFALGMLFLPLIFYPILAFGKSEYIG